MSTYNSAKNRQSETRSSAWAFLLVGCIGFVIILLALLGVIRLPFGTFPLLIMEVMFVIFLVIAGLSFKHAMNMLDEINKSGTTILVVTHNKEIVNEMKKRVITLKKGVIISDEEEGAYIDED